MDRIEEKMTIFIAGRFPSDACAPGGPKLVCAISQKSTRFARVGGLRT